MLVLHLSHIFAARGIDKPFAFLIKAGFTYHTAHKLTTSSTRVFRLNHIEKLCEVLRCQPNDLLRFQPTKEQALQENHPLLPLKFDIETKSFKEIISTMTFQEIQALVSAKTSSPAAEVGSEPPTKTQ